MVLLSVRLEPSLRRTAPLIVGGLRGQRALRVPWAQEEGSNSQGSWQAFAGQEWRLVMGRRAKGSNSGLASLGQWLSVNL